MSKPDRSGWPLQGSLNSFAGSLSLEGFWKALQGRDYPIWCLHWVWSLFRLHSGLQSPLSAVVVPAVLEPRDFLLSPLCVRTGAGPETPGAAWSPGFPQDRPPALLQSNYRRVPASASSAQPTRLCLDTCQGGLAWQPELLSLGVNSAKNREKRCLFGLRQQRCLS